mmetsp:Transcript_44589/g.82702  ORF Transcript_44589/g.82702 Transcript_44589/m.82702 type:complete len:187 (-) Transcript_44589:106-666(-)|eukprot:CAMPEP_0197462342 /NCGR_PEP_ID=MMETSP1175-20131217/58816_1 /TAXON_ID=1003142 /ORGANISM="Triceratium dubium, Strain CCMP147" /LENGTH=186 /DNA_ID=CAMNT_0042997813 /DNA_START=115 /DNA_END=675 /DNA_ORIENTATION=+
MKFPIIAAILALVLIRANGRLSTPEESRKTEYRNLQGGGIKKCRYTRELRPGRAIKRGEGICDDDLTFGVTKGKGKLQLLRGNEVMWTAGVQGIGFCNMNKGGSFACYQGSPGNPEGGAIWALNCGGPKADEPVFMRLDGSDGDVLNMMNSKKGWWIDSEDGEPDGERYRECRDGTCECKPKKKKL